jgi:hypothetical protein
MHNKRLRGSFLMAAFGLIVVAAAHADPAVRIDSAGCVFLDGNGSLVFFEADRTVITSAGNINTVCKGTVAPAAGGGAVTYDLESTGLVCVTFGCVTEKWHETVSANGNATVTCRCGPST